MLKNGGPILKTYYFWSWATFENWKFGHLGYFLHAVGGLTSKKIWQPWQTDLKTNLKS